MSEVQSFSSTFNEQSIRNLLEEHAPVIDTIADLRHHRDSPMARMDHGGRREYVLRSMSSRMKTILEGIWNAIRRSQSACAVQVPLLCIRDHDVRIYDSEWVRYEEYMISTLRSKVKIQGDLSKESRAIVASNPNGAPAVSELNLGGASSAMIQLHWDGGDSEHIKEWLRSVMAPSKPHGPEKSVVAAQQKDLQVATPVPKEATPIERLSLPPCINKMPETSSEAQIDGLMEKLFSIRKELSDLQQTHALLVAEGQDSGLIQRDIDELKKRRAEAASELDEAINPHKRQSYSREAPQEASSPAVRQSPIPGPVPSCPMADVVAKQQPREISTKQEAAAVTLTSKEQIEMPRFLAEYYAYRQNPANCSLITKIGYALTNGYRNIAMKLITAGEEDLKDLYIANPPPFFLAISQKDEEAVSAMIAHGADVNYVPPKLIGGRLSPSKYEETSPLIYSIECHSLGVAKLLISKGADVNGGTYRGQTPLVFAVEMGDLDAVNLLLKSGASPTKPGYGIHGGYHTPVSLALEKGRKDIAEALIKAESCSYI